METTQDIYQTAIKFAGEAHRNQLVPGSEANYLLHISNVAMEVLFAHKHKANFNLDFAVQVAILHDVIEDTEISFTEVADKFSIKIAQAVQALSKDKKIKKSLQLTDSLKRILSQPKEVAIVKLADRITNLQKPPLHWTTEKKQTYLEQAINIHKQLASSNEYLANRLQQKIEAYKLNIS